ncbi:MAG TPA: DUF6602 domain-containing protein [Planctomycetota bacterium]|nr:DUF6602 domain-containing protein [Planctomycetota bacterium]
MRAEAADFVTGRTLGGRAAEFWWRADALGNLAIRRTGTRGQSHAPKGRLVSREELEALLAWMAPREWVLLECLPAKIRAGAAREGLGRFVCESLHWPPCDAPFASHVAAVLVAAEVLAWNNRKREQAFRLVAPDLARVRARYERLRAQAAAAAGEGTPRQPEPPAPPRRARPGGQTPPQVNLYHRFRALSRELRAQIESVSGGRHPADKGGRREAIVRAFLRRLLPDRYRLARGEVYAESQESSPQVDILVYDAAAPVLLDAEDSVVVAAESVYAAIELKPLLRRGELAEAVDSLRQVKALRPTCFFRPVGRPDEPRHAPNPPAFTAVFSVDSVSPHQTLQTLQELDGDAPAFRCLDCVCLLDRGIIFREPGLLAPPQWPDTLDERRVRRLACLEAGEDSLLLFYILLFEQLSMRRSHLPDLRAYARGIPVGKAIYPR